MNNLLQFPANRVTTTGPLKDYIAIVISLEAWRMAKVDKELKQLTAGLPKLKKGVHQ